MPAEHDALQAMAPRREHRQRDDDRRQPDAEQEAGGAHPEQEPAEPGGKREQAVAQRLEGEGGARPVMGEQDALQPVMQDDADADGEAREREVEPRPSGLPARQGEDIGGDREP